MLFTFKIKFGAFAVQYWKIPLFLKFFWTHKDLAWITAIFCFKKYDTFLPIFCKTQNFGHLVWALRVAPEQYDIGGSKSIIWSTPSPNGLVLNQLLTSGGPKNHFFVSGVTSRNNHLHLSYFYFSFEKSYCFSSRKMG